MANLIEYISQYDNVIQDLRLLFERKRNVRNSNKSINFVMLMKLSDYLLLYMKYNLKLY